MKSIEVIDGKVALHEAEMPLVGPYDILIKVKSTAVNRADLMQKKGLYPPPPGASEILGLECSGIVDAVGEKVVRLPQTLTLLEAMQSNSTLPNQILSERSLEMEDIYLPFELYQLQ